jgi:hypothetical protein
MLGTVIYSLAPDNCDSGLGFEASRVAATLSVCPPIATRTRRPSSCPLPFLD